MLDIRSTIEIRFGSFGFLEFIGIARFHQILLGTPKYVARTFSWIGYTASPSLVLLLSMVSQTTLPLSRNSPSLPERYHPIQRSSLRSNSATVTPDQSLPRKKSFFSLPKNPPIAASLSEHRAGEPGLPADCLPPRLPLLTSASVHDDKCISSSVKPLLMEAPDNLYRTQ